MPLAAPTRLRTNQLVSPLGIDDPQPLLSWWVSDDRRGAVQSAWQVRAGRTAGAADLWDSGRRAGGESIAVTYGGRALASGERAWWQVRTWDGAGAESPWSETAFFEMGLLAADDWKGQWIARQEKEHPIPSPGLMLRRVFAVGKPVRQARLYMTARGVYYPFLNGKQVGEERLSPGWTDYHIRIRYQAYDVTAAIGQGENALGALLSDGWYCGHMMWQDRWRLYGDRPWLLGQLVIDYEDGTRDCIATDGSWTCRADGEITQASFLHGDTLDARKRVEGWCSPNGPRSGWEEVALTPRDQVQLVAQRGPAVRKHEELAVLKHWRLESGDWVFDLGQNMVGVVRLRVSGRAGQTLFMRHGEMLDTDGKSVYLANLRSAKATDTFILKGGGEEVFEPPFTLHGFRYVQVAGLEGEVAASTITGLVYQSATAPTGEFECSHAKLNQLQHNIVWGQKGNFVEVPTDCPQRDERLGWTGDAQVFCRTAAFNADVQAFFNRWMIDVGDAQLPDGAYADIAPDILSQGRLGTFGSGAPAWGDAGVIIPWTVYQAYGDRRILERCYDSMVRYMAYLEERCRDGAYPDFGYGDWLAIGSATNRELIGTAYSAYSARLMGRIARLLGRDPSRFDLFFHRLKETFNREFVTPAGRVTSASQTAAVLALRFHLLDEPARTRAGQWLAADVERRGVLTTGFVGCNLILPALSQIGRDDLAWKLLSNEKFPSWLFSVNQGATTIWERWDGWTPEKGFQTVGMNSFNHYAYGSCGEWMYARIGGIDLDECRPGYGRIIVRPVLAAELESARAALDSVRGRIETQWQIKEGVMELRLRIPPTTSAAVCLPGPLLSSDAGNAAAARQPDGRYLVELPAGAYVLRCDVAAPLAMARLPGPTLRPPTPWVST